MVITESHAEGGGNILADTRALVGKGLFPCCLQFPLATATPQLLLPGLLSATATLTLSRTRRSHTHMM